MDIVVVGDYIGAQIRLRRGSADWIDDLQDGEINVPHVDRTIVASVERPS
jgi:hypothetical protein